MFNQHTSYKKKVAIETHGCKLNQADSQALAKELNAAGFNVVDKASAVDIFVLNSCTVTHVADRKARHSLRSARRRNPNATLVVTGCYPERDPTDLQQLSEVDLIINNSSKRDLVRLLMDALHIPPQTNPADSLLDIIPESLNRNRAMVKIQEGCDQVCAYCIVPKVRGREKSVPSQKIIAQVNSYHTAGFQEVVLTGTQLGSYGFDLEGESITNLVGTLLARTSIPRIRISSLQPQDITEAFIDLWDDPRLCPQFHLPLQSGNDNVLKRMRRRYTTSEYLRAVDTIRGMLPAVAITTDIIVGFPDESESEFEDTLQLSRGTKFADTHVFPYSARPGTSAAHFKGMVAPDIKRARSSKLLESGRSNTVAFRKRFIGETRPVLWERQGPDSAKPIWIGLTDNYIPTTTVSSINLRNRITVTHLSELDCHTLKIKGCLSSDVGTQNQRPLEA